MERENMIQCECEQALTSNLAPWPCPVHGKKYTAGVRRKLGLLPPIPQTEKNRSQVKMEEILEEVMSKPVEPRKEHEWENQEPGLRCSVCQLGWWGDTSERNLPKCGSKEALDLAHWQLTEGKRKDAMSIEERLAEHEASKQDSTAGPFLAQGDEQPLYPEPWVIGCACVQNPGACICTPDVGCCCEACVPMTEEDIAWVRKQRK